MDRERGNAVIELIGIWKSFGRQTVLKGINLTVMEGKTTVIIGTSGGGKSLILKHMLGLVRPDRGRVLVFGKDLATISRRDLDEVRKHFGVLFQNVALFDSMTVYDNVALPLRERTDATEEEIRQNVEEKLSLMDLEGADEKYPAQLSGGMKKRVGLARAIASEPEILLYDEPTTGLDPIMADVINELVISMKSILNVTSISITHDMTSAYKIGDKIAMLYNGKIVEVGTPDEVRSSENPIVRQFIEGRAEGPITEESEEFVKFDTKPAEPIDRRK